MRKIGSISAALGLIFLGVWMIINMNNPELGREIIRWWPLIIIFVGIEILISLTRKTDNERIGLSGLIIPVILIFLFANFFSGLLGGVNGGLEWLKSGGIFNNSGSVIRFDNDWTSINTKKVLSADNSILVFNTNNGDIKVEKARDNNFTIEAEVYVTKRSNVSKYDIIEKKISNGYEVNIDESFVKGVKATLYVPEGTSVKFGGSNMQIKGSELSVNKFDIDISNGNIDLQGDIPTANIKLSNGKVNIDNKVSKDINVDLNNGMVNLYTQDKNITSELDINWGQVEFNNDKRVNSGMKKSIGTGEGKVKIDINNGTIKVISQE